MRGGPRAESESAGGRDPLRARLRARRAWEGELKRVEAKVRRLATVVQKLNDAATELRPTGGTLALDDRMFGDRRRHHTEDTPSPNDRVARGGER